jgi:hypothetical protein
LTFCALKSSIRFLPLLSIAQNNNPKDRIVSILHVLIRSARLTLQGNWSHSLLAEIAAKIAEDGISGTPVRRFLKHTFGLSIPSEVFPTLIKQISTVDYSIYRPDPRSRGKFWMY